MRLVDASEYGSDSPRACLDLLNAQRAKHGEPQLPPPPAGSQRFADKLLAYVNHGRWVVDCLCGSAQLASRTDRRFWCVDCRNGWALGKWVEVVWPANADDIEGLLLQRPFSKNQNWTTGEDVMTLVAENVAAGLGA